MLCIADIQMINIDGRQYIQFHTSYQNYQWKLKRTWCVHKTLCPTGVIKGQGVTRWVNTDPIQSAWPPEISVSNMNIVPDIDRRLLANLVFVDKQTDKWTDKPNCKTIYYNDLMQEHKGSSMLIDINKNLHSYTAYVKHQYVCV